ncbi:hypothetical protein IMZ48_15680 [Candidatus Bathyarchaeota archaeon]|nr:hypothetical protein [Candidatus Bathyarchaeota archaeon]
MSPQPRFPRPPQSPLCHVANRRTTGFWAWFPFGPVLFRTLLLTAGGFVILILRVAQYHVGVRTSNSAFHNVLHSLIQAQTYWTLLWYAVSAVTLCLPLLSSYSADSDFHWIVYRNGDRARLNEKPLFFTTYILSCAVVQALGHVFTDVDKVLLREAPKEVDSNGQEIPLGPVGQIFGKLSGILASSIKSAVLMLCIHMSVYFIFIRRAAWGWTLVFLRPFYNLPKSNILPPTSPSTFHTLKTCVVAGVLVFFLWKTANMAFSTFMARKPLKSGKPLTVESKDPNGSLIDGLKSKKQYIRVSGLYTSER